jgi:hypothetical protein
VTTVANYIAIQDSSTTLSPPGLLADFPDVNAHGDGAEVVISGVVIVYRLEI